MKRTEQVLAQMRTAPERVWSSAEISVALACAPGQVTGSLKYLAAQGEVVQVASGQFRLSGDDDRRLPTPLDAPATGAPAPAPQVHAPVTAAEGELLIGALRRYGQPLPGSALAGRLRRAGFDLTRVTLVASHLVARQALVRHQDGRYALPHWGTA